MKGWKRLKITYLSPSCKSKSTDAARDIFVSPVPENTEGLWLHHPHSTNPFHHFARPSPAIFFLNAQFQSYFVTITSCPHHKEKIISFIFRVTIFCLLTSSSEVYLTPGCSIIFLSIPIVFEVATPKLNVLLEIICYQCWEKWKDYSTHFVADTFSLAYHHFLPHDSLLRSTDSNITWLCFPFIESWNGLG